MRKSGKSLKLIIFLIIFFLIDSNVVAGVMGRPRHISLLKTEHFDIIFPTESESVNTAKLIADNADRLYEKAKSTLEGSADLRIPVIISPASDKLSVEYTCSPYNRIVIFDGVPEENQQCFQNSILGLFYHEIYLALSQTIMGKVNQFIYKTVGGDGYQPISLFYLPLSFVEGRAFLAEGVDLVSVDEDESYSAGKNQAENENPDEQNQNEQNSSEQNLAGENPVELDYEGQNYYGRFSDREFLEILSLAKYENNFPNWVQAGSIRDIYPGQKVNDAAGSAFAAFLMQKYGIDKYIELWNKCGEINFYLTAGMFKSVYGISLNDLWHEFEDAVPLPKDLDKIKEMEKNTKVLFPNATENLIKNLIISDYGLIWYDGIRHEVDILDWNSALFMRQLLFMASDVNSLSLSPDGRYLVVSFYGITSRPEYKNAKTWIYDLQERAFLKTSFKLKEGIIVNTDSSRKQFVGIDVKDKKPVLQVYDFKYDDKATFVCEKDFCQNEYPNSLTYSGKGKVSYLISKNNFNSLHQYDIENETEKAWEILYDGQPLNIKNLRLLKTDKIEIDELKNQNIYTFEYYLPDEPSFARMGLIKLDENYEPVDVYIQNHDLAGGVQSPVFYKDDLYYCSRKTFSNEIKYVPFKDIDFVKGGFKKIYVAEENGNVSVENYEVKDNKLGEYDLEKYSPFKYMINCSVKPFLALKDLATTKPQLLWPSLGATIVTQYDPLMNNRIMFSASGAYAKLDYNTVVNPTIDDINKQKLNSIDDDKNISFGLSIENTSTPVDIRSGCIFKFNTSGEYNFTAAINGLWQLPLGMDFSKLDFSLLSNYTASTDYYDPNLSDHYPSKTNWPSFKNAYETAAVSLGVEYSNTHQYGLSKYEERGFSIGLNLYSLWDITEIRDLNRRYREWKDSNKKDESGLTQAQVKKLYDENLLMVSQLNLGVSGEVKIPKLIPVNMIKGFVLSLPTTIKADLFSEIGSAVHASAETLLVGYECQNGFPFLYTFFSRLGIKFGYDLNLNYDTYKIPLPDIRKKDNLWNVFSNIYLRDSIYFIYDMDFSSTIGRLSQGQFNLSMKTEYFIRSKGFAFSMLFLVSF